MEKNIAKSLNDHFINLFIDHSLLFTTNQSPKEFIKYFNFDGECLIDYEKRYNAVWVSHSLILLKLKPFIENQKSSLIKDMINQYFPFEKKEILYVGI